MKEFLVTQTFAVASEIVHAALCEKATWQSFTNLPFVGTPELRSFTGGVPVEVSMAYKVAMQLPALAASFIDAERLTFVEQTTLNADGSGNFDIQPDHYADMLRASGTIEMVPTNTGGCERRITGWVDLSLGWAGKLFEAPVEEAIVTGFSQAIDSQALQIPVS